MNVMSCLLWVPESFLFSCTSHFWLNCSSDYEGKVRHTKNLFLKRNSSGEASLALNTLIALTLIREQLEKSTGSMLHTNSCTGGHFYWILDWMRNLGIPDSRYLQFQICQICNFRFCTVWHRKVNPSNRNDSFPRVASTLAHRFFTFYFYFIIT